MQQSLFDAKLSKAAGAVLLFIDRYTWAVDELRDDVVLVTRVGSWDAITGEQFDAALSELVEAGKVIRDGDTIRRIPDAET